MASAAPPKRMVSSVFITLASPHQATVTPQREQPQPALQVYSAPAREKQHPAARISPGDSIPALRHKRDDHSPLSESYGNLNSKGLTHSGSSALVSDPWSHNPAKPEAGKTKLQKENDKRSSPELFPLPPPPPPPPLTPPSDAPPLCPGELFSEESALPPPPPAQESFPHPVTPGQQPVYNPEVKARTPSSGLSPDDQIQGIHQNSQDKESKDLCGFCRKPMTPSEPAIEALNRIYHDGCFQCRSCHIPLAGKQYYNKAGIPLCEDCYQASLELCWACGEAITDHIIRALERAYHLSCFTCTTCKKQIGEQAFAQGEVGEVYCLQDYYRKYAPKCSACDQLIIPKEDGTDSYTVECLGRSYHENCYRCEVCVIQLSPEPNEHGCYPLDGKMLCKSCHLNLASGQH